MASKEIKVEVRAETGQFEKAMDKVADSAGRVGTNLSGDGVRIQQFFKQLNDSAKMPVSSLQVLGKESDDGLRDKLGRARESILSVNMALKGVMAATAIGSVAAVGSAIADVGLSAIRASAQMRQYEVAFSTMLKSQEKGKEMLADLQQFAVETPFDVEGVVSTSQKLMAFGVEADRVVDTMRVLGDATAAFGGGAELLDRMGYALGQMRVSGRLNAQDMNQLANAGIPAWEMLAEAAGKSVAEVRQASEQGLIDGKAAADVIMAGMQDRYSGAMEAMSQEVSGLWSNIAETGQVTLATVGDYLIDAFDVKGVLQSVSDALGSVSTALMKAKQDGKSFGDAIKEAVPTPVIVAFGSFAGVIGGALVAACAAGAVALAGLVAPVAPFIAIMAAVGAAITGLCVYWDDLSAVCADAWAAIEDATSRAVGVLAEVFVVLAAGGVATVLRLGEGIVSIITSALDEAGGYCPEFLKVFQSMLSDAFDAVCSWGDNCIAEIKRVLTMQAAVEEAMSTAYTGSSSEEKPKKKGSDFLSGARERFREGFSNTGGASSVGGHGGGRGAVDMSARRESDDMKRKEQEINRVTEALGRAQEATRQLTDGFADLKADVGFAGMRGSDAVYEEIRRERDQRIQALDDVLAKQKQAITDAEKLRESASKTGDKKAIADADALCKVREGIYADGLRERAMLEDEIRAQQDAKMLRMDTAMNAARADMNEAMNAANMASFCAYLEGENVARLAALEEEQALRQQMFDWRMESEQSLLSFGLEAAESVKEQLSSGFADMITQGGTLAEIFRDVTRSVVNMFVKYMAEKRIAAALDSVFARKSASEQTAAAGSIAAGYVPAAVQKSIAELGPIAGPVAYGAAITSMTAAGASLSASAIKLAGGGMVYGAGTSTSDSIPAMLSNGEYVVRASAVRRIGLPMLNAINAGKGFADGGVVSASSFAHAVQPSAKGTPALKNVNVSITAMDASGFSDFLRNGGLDEIKQALFDSDRNFASAAGVW